MNSSSTFHLRLFGSPSIVQPDRELLVGPAVQRHRLALLAVLALSSGRAVSRDKLLAYLWPERDTSHARQLLNQASHSLRKALGDEALLSAGDDLRLNLEVVRVDVIDFETALEHGEHENAFRLYAGPFLDGFYLSSAPEFEQWADRERSRLASAYAAAVEALATAAENSGDQRGAVAWWKALAAHDPFDSRVTLRLMQALAAGGNRAGALQHAGVHERLLQDNYGVPPRPEVLAFAARLRDADAVASIAEPLPVSRVGTSNDAADVLPNDAVPDAPALADTTPAAVPELPRRSRGQRRLLFASLVVVATIAAAVTAIRARSGDSAGGTAEPSIAVLPIANLGTDPRDAVLADGMTEELIATMAQNAGVRVIARTSVLGFRGEGLDARAIADSLQVSHLLEGAIQRSDDRLRVRVRLIDGRDGSTRWSETFDRELDDVFAVQDEIARAVSREMGLRLGFGTPRRPQTQNIAAYELYLRGSNPAMLRSDSTAREALAYLRQAVALDTAYAAAHAVMARLLIRAGSGDRRSPPSISPAMAHRERIALAEQAALRALALDDALAEGYASLGLVRGQSRDAAAAETLLERAVALAPGIARYHEYLERLYASTGRHERALAEARRAVELDPLSPSATAELARALLVNGRSDEALAQLDKIAAVRPPLLRVAGLRAHGLIRTGRANEALELLAPRLGTGDSFVDAHVGYALARAGRRDDAERVAATLVDRWREGRGGATDVAVVYAGLGNLDEAFRWLDRGVDDYSLSILSVYIVPLDLLHDDPRYARILERLGYQKR